MAQKHMLIIVSLLYLSPLIHGWGDEGHIITCRIAQSLLSEEVEKEVKQLLPEYAEGDLGSLCPWADDMRFRYHWSSPLHYVNTPDVCSYQYRRDCKDGNGERGRCVVGAIYNYTSQLISRNKASGYNLTEALLFLSHFMGDIHQPLHAGFASDKGGNTIYVHWYTRKQNLHHVWDNSIIEKALESYYDSNMDNMTEAIQQNIENEWAGEVESWEACDLKSKTCPNTYASESIKAACDWAYKDATEGSVLKDEYFLSRLPIVTKRLAQGGVRLAATLNRIFSSQSSRVSSI